MHVSSARIWLALAIAAVIGLSLASVRFFGHYQPLSGLMGGPQGMDRIGLQVRDAEVTGRVAGLRRWQVAAHLITFSRDQRQVIVDGLTRGVLYDARTRPVAALAAGGATYQSPSPVFGTGPQGFLQITGGIRARLLRAGGPTLAAAGLSWNPARNLVQSAGTVFLHFPASAGAAIGGARMTANGVQWDSQADRLLSPGQVQVAFAGGAGDAVGTGVSVDLHTGNLTLRALNGTFHLARLVQNDMARRSTHPRSTHPVAALAGFALVAAPLAAAPEKPVTYSAGASLWLNAQHQAQMSQGVTIRQDDETLQTQAAIFNFDDQQRALNAESRAPVHLWDTQNDLTGLHGYVDFTTHVATLHDDVTLTVKPGPQNADAPKSSLKSRFKSPATMTCALMTYNYRTKTGTVPGPLTVHQKDRVLTADSGTYDGRLQIITLIGHVHGHNGDGDIDAPEATIGVREGEEFVRVDKPLHGILTPKPDNTSKTASGDSAPVDDPQGYAAIMNGGALPAETPPAADSTAAGAPGGAGSTPGAPPASPIAPATPAPPGTPASPTPAQAPPGATKAAAP